MSIIPVPTKARKRGQNLTIRLIEAKVAKPIKVFDAAVTGLYASLNATTPPTFWLKYTEPATHQRRSIRIGVYHRELFDIARARVEAMALKARIGNGEDVAQARRQQRDQQAKQGVTVDRIIDEYVVWISQPVLKPDGELRPKVESWDSVASHLRRFVSPRLGRMIASEVTNDDIAALQTDIADGTIKCRSGRKGSPSNARHMRKAVSGLFKWAAEAGKHKYVSASPCVNLPKLDAERPRDRVLSEAEIRTLWHGLDRDDLPWDRTTRLGLKFALVTMLRSTEMLHIHRSELNLDAEGGPTVDIPARRVKKRRVINQPLSDLAIEIIRAAMPGDDQAFVFAGRFGGDAPLSRQAMSGALKGTMKTVKGVKVTRTPGLCDLLGLESFTPHDLRRTAATWCGELNLPDADISLCLDHQKTKDVPAVTAIYNRAVRVKVARKRAVLDRWAIELRRIVGEPEAKAVDTKLQLAA